MVEPSEEVTRPLHATQGTDLPDFAGHHARTIDDKARLTLPAGLWRSWFDGIAYVGGWRGGSVAVWTAASFRAALDKLAAQEREGTVPAGALEVFRRNVHSVPIDGQGRLTIPPQVREVRPIGAGIEVVADGEGDRVVLRRAEAVAPDTELFDSVVELFDNR